VGAALLAGVGTGIYADLAEACQQVVRYGPVTTPNTVNQARYEELYARFVRLYPLLREEFHGLAGISK
jgi:xylulokinase